MMMKTQPSPESAKPAVSPRAGGGRRKKRFVRDKNPEPMRLTERDLAMIHAVYQHRFLSSTHLIALMGGSRDKVLRRLQALYHNGYLDRPREQLTPHAMEGTKPFVYGLSDRGATLLEQYEGIARGKIRWSAKNDTAQFPFIQHTLLVADFMVALEVACRAHGGITLLTAQTILEERAPQQTRARQNPLKMMAKLMVDGESVDIGVVPDAFFGLRYADAPPGQNETFFFLEADRQTMVQKSRDFSGKNSTIYRKMLGYFGIDREKRYIAQFGIRNARVLFFTLSRPRADNMIALNKVFRDGEGLSMFLFNDYELISSPDFLRHPWRNGRGNERQPFILS